jgi:hypothetical protein
VVARHAEHRQEGGEARLVGRPAVALAVVVRGDTSCGAFSKMTGVYWTSSALMTSARFSSVVVPDWTQIERPSKSVRVLMPESRRTMKPWPS